MESVRKNITYILVAGTFVALFYISIFLIFAPAQAASCSAVTYRQGSKGTCVTTIQQRLTAYKCSPGPIDGIFGSMTAGAVKRFQTANNLYVDGVVGPQTWPNLLGSTAVSCVDDDAKDRALCTNAISKCILVHRVNGVNRLELYENKKLVASTIINTGIAGFRTRNTTSSYIYDETFKTEASEQVTNAKYGISPKTWAPGVRQLYDAGKPGLMGDPHKFNGGQAFHWRVQYSSAKDEYSKSIPVLSGGKALESTYNGGYASHGCVHVPKAFLDKYDSTFFQYGVRVRVQDQPTS